MVKPFTARGYPRYLLLSLVALAAVALATAEVVMANGAPPPKNPPIEEEDTARPKKPLKPLRFNEQDTSRKPGEAPRLADVAAEAEQTAYSAIQTLCRDLRTPYDRVTWKDGHVTLVMPTNQYVGSAPDPKGTVNLRFMDGNKKSVLGLTQVALGEIDRIDHFEQITIKRVDDFLNKSAGEIAPGKAAPTRMEILQAAEKVLTAVSRFHASARDSSPAESSSWAEVGGRLRRKLADIQIEQMKTLADGHDWLPALTLALRLVKANPDRDFQNQVAEHLARLTNQAVADGNYDEARQRLKVLEEHFPDVLASTSIAKTLKQRAEDLFEKAKELEKTDKRGASDALMKAERIWPRLPRLRDYRLRLNNAYPILRVGVRALPEFMSPATAYTDSERQAVELLFESLIKVQEQPGVGETFAPQIAVRVPRVSPRARHFTLPRDIYWSKSENQLNAGDVRLTVRLLSKPDWEGNSPAWSALVEALPGKDPFQVDLGLSQGFWEPLSLMTFKILPAAANLERPNDPGFARQPWGSGPYQYQGISDNEAVFIANPNYHRAGKPGMPYIREIHMFHSDDPVTDFRNGRLQLLLDLSTEGVQPLRSLDNVEVKTLANRRVYFLAVNHRSHLLDDANVRKAIAHAIDRQKILNDVFRKQGSEAAHRILNGPFPSDSWASNPAVKADLLDLLLAKGRAAKVKEHRSNLTLHLKYPADPNVQRACELIRDQIQEAAGIAIELEARSSRQMWQDVEVDHNYELAYYHFDFPDELYWLWPLFNTHPRALEPGGGNYLGYDNDSELESAFRAAMGHREFSQVRRFTHAIHDIMVAKMPLIPLWQLDSHIAIHRDVKAVNLDPLLVFPDIEKWKLGNK